MPGKHKNCKSYVSPSRIRGQKLTDRERTKILILSNYAGWSNGRIARELRIAISTVRLVVISGVYTSHKQIGRRPILTTQKRCRLVKQATINIHHR
jgi:hypothetical protein